MRLGINIGLFLAATATYVYVIDRFVCGVLAICRSVNLPY